MPQSPARVCSLQVGAIRLFEAGGPGAERNAPTGIFKTPVDGPLLVHATGVQGDAQADLVNHGGTDKAVCVYSAEHFPRWSAAIGQPFTPGAFGENLTLLGIDEDGVCIGDRWAAGDVVLQVSQPRQPCWKLSRKWGFSSFADQVIASRRTGWYFRVLSPGAIARDATLRLVARSHPLWTITAANDVMYERPHDLARCAALAAVEPLAASWKRTLSSRASRG